MKLKNLLIGLVLVFASVNANAFWGGNNNNFGNNGWGNNWPVWTPMYWMEEFTGNNNYNDYYGNANPWSGAPLNNMPYNNANPWSNGAANTNMFPPNGYSPYAGGSTHANSPHGYGPVTNFQNRPLVPSRGPTYFRP